MNGNSLVIKYIFLINKKKSRQFLQSTTRCIKLNQTAISRGQKAVMIQQKRKKRGKQISEWHVRMHFYLCLREEAQEGPLKSFRWDHCCIPHYWLWDLAQSGRIPSHITVQRLGLMLKKKTSGVLFPSLRTDKPCLPRGGDKAAYCLRKKTN